MKFEELGIRPEILRAIERMGFVEPTPIQKRSIPEILAGHDLVGQSLTGSGKTAAYAIPLVQKIQAKAGIQVLILTPTRELALQVKDKIDEFSEFMKVRTSAVYGGVAINPQISELRNAEIVVATPGRMLDHMERGTINLENVRTLVLDEADKMFEMGFIDDVKLIMTSLPKDRQTILFSATMPGEVVKVIKTFLKTPKLIREKLHVEGSLLRQVYYDISSKDKFSLLMHLLKDKTPGLAIIFCGTRREVDVIAKNLKKQGVHAMAVHGGLSQNKRSNAVDSLKNEDIQVLVATDVAARGLDVNNITNVYNYDCAKNSEEYTHRIGRTARAGKSGIAVTLLTERDHDNFRNILRDINLKIEKEDIPNFERIQFMRVSSDGHGNLSEGREGGRYGGRDDRRGGRSSGFGGRSGERSGGFGHSRGGSRGESRGGSREGGYSSRGPRSDSSRSDSSRAPRSDRPRAPRGDRPSGSRAPSDRPHRTHNN
jgi:ATP-dependent RNA helicase DeaD